MTRIMFDRSIIKEGSGMVLLREKFLLESFVIRVQSFIGIEPFSVKQVNVEEEQIPHIVLNVEN